MPSSSNKEDLNLISDTEIKEGNYSIKIPNSTLQESMVKVRIREVILKVVNIKLTLHNFVLSSLEFGSLKTNEVGDFDSESTKVLSI